VKGEFSYLKPQNLIDAHQALKGEGAHLLAGGTDLLVQIRSGKRNPRVLVDLKGLEELNGIEDRGDFIRVGSLTTINQILDSELLKAYSALLDGARVLGCCEIRHRATIGGNICNASPSGDVLIPLLLFEPVLVIQNFDNGKREVPMGNFFEGTGKTMLAQGEILTEILLPKVPGRKSLYRKKSRVKGMDLSSISLALSAYPSPSGRYNFRIAFGAVTARPGRMIEAEKVLSGKPLSVELIDQAVTAVQQVISPRESSLRGTPEYKRAMISVMLKDGITELVGGDILEN